MNHEKEILYFRFLKVKNELLLVQYLLTDLERFGSLILYFSILMYIYLFKATYNYQMKKALLLFFLIPFSYFSQIKGKIVDFDTKEKIVAAKLLFSDGNKALSDTSGAFQIKETRFPVTVITSYIGYVTDTLLIENSSSDILISLKIISSDLGTFVVTAGRRPEKIENLAISMELLKPSLIDNKGISDLE